MAKTSGPRTGKSARRREDIRRNLPKPAFDYKALIDRPEFVRATVIMLVFAALTSGIIAWSRQQPRVHDAQIMVETRLKRVDYTVLDEQATENKRDEARRSAPRIYRLNDDYLDRFEAAFLGLPRAVSGKTWTEISDDLRKEYGLTADGVTELQKYAIEGEPSPAWQRAVVRLVKDELRRHPLIESAEYQRFTVKSNLALALSDGRLEPIRPDTAIELLSADWDAKVTQLITAAGFDETVIPYVWAWMLKEPVATLIYDEARTAQQEDVAADAVEAVMIQHTAGEVLWRRGDVIGAPAGPSRNDILVEADRHRAAVGPFGGFGQMLGLFGLCCVVTLALGLYLATNHPQIIDNSLRVTALALLIGGTLLLVALASARVPDLVQPTAIAATLFLSVVLLLAYDQRLALVVGSVEIILLTMALNSGVGTIVLLMAGVTSIIAQLRDVRHRNSLIRSAGVTAGVLAVAAIVLGLATLPSVDGVGREILESAGLAAGASFIVGFFVLGTLPTIERVFDITTGMTLAELRDPKQPLLRQLQQMAPGTYNHSLQVANICEAAAEAIGANGLLVYVGALYHDIGKMNKPEYFVENQADGDNKHAKLSPAMSLLVIIGHVKDGIELAREYKLPRPLIHFIEAHHGTTLVEYFFHAARTQAEAEQKPTIDEVEFRYPGPRPKTKETAILMLSDAVESATRAMGEPNPSRIESLVREIAQKRLTDGQFDDCPLTFRDLGLIEEAIISRLNAIHHSRISYPSNKDIGERDNKAG
jgi:putative nucleotidyltransferase with HDIG domain